MYARLPTGVSEIDRHPSTARDDSTFERLIGKSEIDRSD